MEAFLTLALVAALSVHAALAAGVRVLTLVNICESGQRKEFGCPSPWDVGKAVGSYQKPCLPVASRGQSSPSGEDFWGWGLGFRDAIMERAKCHPQP